MSTIASPATYRRVYVWELPVRFFHWTSAVCILTLGATGYLIGRPVSITYMPEAYQQYWFGTVRAIHFVTAYIFLFSFIYRLYWGFVGNRFARWDQFIPYRKAQWEEISEVLRVDIMQTTIRGRISIGHNMLAGAVYFCTFFVFVFQVLTGFGLYASMSDSPLVKPFAWVSAFMGGDMAVRQWHHAMLWFYVVFFLVHVYLVFYHDYVEGRGTMSSMVGGWKFERDEDLTNK